VGGFEGGVVDDDGGALVRCAGVEVELLGSDVPLHGGVVGVGACAVSGRHAGGCDLEGDVEEDRELPGVGQFLAVEEEAIGNQDCAGWSDLVGRVEDLVAG